jgi:hypothetical protein
MNTIWVTLEKARELFAAELGAGEIEIGHLENVRFVESPVAYPALTLPVRSRRAQWKRDQGKFRYAR